MQMPALKGSGSRGIYRARQFLRALRPRLDAAEVDRARKLLDEPLLRLFLAMEKRDQSHALAVTHRLLDAGVDDRDLLTAALLHDCAKGWMPVWLRVLRVVSPRLLARVAGHAASTGWRGAAYRLLHDDELSAKLATEAGASAATARFIRGHVMPEEEPKLRLLQAADDAS
jgi:hypothetical protein